VIDTPLGVDGETVVPHARGARATRSRAAGRLAPLPHGHCRFVGQQDSPCPGGSETVKYEARRDSLVVREGNNGGDCDRGKALEVEGDIHVSK
jgi:hypothetical protein